MRAQRLGWDEGTSGERVWGTRGWGGMMGGERVWGTRGWDGMRVQVDDQRYKWRESMRAQRLGWDEGTSGERV